MLKWFWGRPSQAEAEILKQLDAREAEGIASMRVVGRGTLTLDPREVQRTPRFQRYQAQAKALIEAQT